MYVHARCRVTKLLCYLQQWCSQGRLECANLKVKKMLTILGICLLFEPPPVHLSGPVHGFILKLCRFGSSVQLFFIVAICIHPL